MDYVFFLPQRIKAQKINRILNILENNVDFKIKSICDMLKISNENKNKW